MIGVRIEGVGSVVVGTANIAVPDVDISRSGLVRLTGPNGAGKSSVLELLGGGLRPRVGRAQISGLDAHLRGARERRTMTRSESALLPGVSLAAHARMFARAAAVSHDAALRALAHAGLAAKALSAAGSLSTGERQRAWLALTTLRDARVRLLDEPFLGLDAAAARRLIADIERWSERGIVVLVDHEQREIDATVSEIRMSAR